MAQHLILQVADLLTVPHESDWVARQIHVQVAPSSPLFKPLNQTRLQSTCRTTPQFYHSRKVSSRRAKATAAVDSRDTALLQVPPLNKSNTSRVQRDQYTLHVSIQLLPSPLTHDGTLQMDCFPAKPDRIATSK